MVLYQKKYKKIQHLSLNEKKKKMTILDNFEVFTQNYLIGWCC